MDESKHFKNCFNSSFPEQLVEEGAGAGSGTEAGAGLKKWTSSTIIFSLRIRPSVYGHPYTIIRPICVKNTADFGRV